MTNVDRRKVIKAIVNGGLFSVGLPIFDCLLNSNGDAWADGAPLPPVFGVWFQHLGLNPGMWEPKKIGEGFENNTQLKDFDVYRKRMNVFSGMKYYTDGKPVQTHTTGAQIATTGMIPAGTEGLPSLDSLVADTIGTRTRFRSLEVNLSGSRRSLSQRSGTSPNPSEGSPAALYKRIFGPEFKDPNAATFEPDPMTLARQSVLSNVTEQLRDTKKSLGVADKARLDSYLTSIRQVEQQLAIELTPPVPMAGCKTPAAEEEASPGTVLEDAAVNCRIFANLLGCAAACGQTQVFNVLVDSQGLRKQGSPYTWHIATHEASVDEKLGYQKDVYEFNAWANGVFLGFLQTLEGIKEGPGSLLDRTLVLWLTEHSDARVHSLEKVPVMTFGNGGGRIKTGIHVSAPGDAVARVGLTVQQAMGVAVNRWGEGGNATSKTISEIMV